MNFRCFTVGTSEYGSNEEGFISQMKQLSNVNFHDQQFENIIEGEDSEYKQEIKNYLLHLALNHTVNLDRLSGTYNAASPDELAFVNFAKQFGMEFKGRDGDDNIIIVDDGVERRYKQLGVCEFNSDRKKSSNIIRHEDGTIVIYTKGADSAIRQVLKFDQRSKDNAVYEFTGKNVSAYATQGLRTLYLAQKVLNESEYEQWYRAVENANEDLEEREALLDQAHKIIENDMELFGSTAIEDKLQEEVDLTIQFLKAAGIKVWVLTGDKVDTAINIGIAAGLIDGNTEYRTIKKADKELI